MFFLLRAVALKHRTAVKYPLAIICGDLIFLEGFHALLFFLTIPSHDLVVIPNDFSIQPQVHCIDEGSGLSFTRRDP